MKWFFAFTLGLFLVLIISSCNNHSSAGVSISPSATTPLPTATTVPTKTPAPTPLVTKATLAGIGDILVHDTVYKDALQKDGTYNFKPMFAAVRQLLEMPDIVVANEESTIGGVALGLSGYPRFNSPFTVGDALQYAGVDFITMANNHALDKGEIGIDHAIAYWDKIGMPHTGVFTSAADRDRIRTRTKNNITFAFLAYTYGTNGISVPAGKPYLVNLMQLDLIRKDISAAKKLADVVVVSLHWGIEYETMPNEQQLSVAQSIANMGADIIIGNHPHVLQPFAWVTRTDGKKTFVMYSLGNFLSAQIGLTQLIGGIGQITVLKTTMNGNTDIRLENPNFIPTYMYYKNFKNFKILPLDQVDEQQLKDSKKTLSDIEKHMKINMPELAFPSSKS